MKRSYSPPVLVAYGRIHEVTMGSSGTKPDAVLSLGPPVSGNHPAGDCGNNVPSSQCFNFEQ